MKAWVRQGGIYIAVLLSCAAFTVISPFYSKVAKDQNIPDWLVGIIISACPSISLVLSLYLPLNIQKLGRTKALIIGMILIGSANIVLGNIIDTSANTSIIMSFISRILAGSGSAFINITSYAILVSEYPEDVSKIVAAIEISSGVGLMIGPAAGSAIFSLGGFYYSCTIIGGIMIAYAPILYLIVGPSKPYILSENNINLLEIAFKPKILLDMGNQFLVMFAIGYLQPTLELHLLSFGIKEKNIGYWFVLNTSCYFASCIFISRITNYISKTKLMIIGNIFMFLFFTLTGPSPIYFSPSLSFVTLSLVFLGLSGGFLYGKFYLVPSLPHMIDVAYLDYDYKEDYRLTDSLSGITNISLCAGEIIGPIVSSFLYYEFGYAKASTIVSFFVLAHGINYAYHSDAFRKIKSKDLLSSELIEYRSTK